ncbi:MAG: helix-turn-helix transcriptional regulator [Clostridium sp.]|uniref:helix-turn-helix transcriptional regulator n=1 Tax=Clostridium sp. TaxID=1506 RepID=UPI003F2D9448
MMNRQLVAYRKGIGFTQTAISKKIGISLSAYSQKETGKLDFTQSEMLKILKLLKTYNPNVTADDIFFNPNVSISITR